MIVATAGHIDHGKTRLVEALTGVDADRLPEEKARGLTIDLGFAYHDLANGERLGFVDVPGHERFIRNMLAGVTAIDFALLVVAVDDGPMPQTAEHLAILDLLGVSNGAVVLSKIDRVGPERVSEVAEAVTALLEPTSLAGAPLFPTSVETGEGIAELKTHLESAAETARSRAENGNFRLAVDRCFTIAGAGLVVTGTVFSGSVATGDQLLLSPRGIPLRIRGIHAQNRSSKTARAGERAALNIAGADLDRAEVHRGDWVLAAPAHAPTRKLDCDVRVLASEARVLGHWTPVHVHLGAVDVTGRIAVLEGRSIAPGATGLAQLVLDREIGAVNGDRLVLRDQTAQRTIAGGRVIDPFPPARGRARPERLAQLKAIRDAEAGSALEASLAQAPAGLRLKPFQQGWNLTPSEADAIFDAAGTVRIAAREAPIGFSPTHWQGLLDSVLETLSRWHERNPESVGASALELRRALPRPVPEVVLNAALDTLLDRDTLRRRGSFLHLPSHAAQPTDEEAAIWQRVAPILEAGGLKAPRVREIAEELRLDLSKLEAFLARAQQLGLVLRVTQNRSFLPETVLALAEIAEALAAEAPDGLFEAKAYRDRSDIGRNLTIEVLEYFDRVGFTRRSTEGRRVLKPAAEAFGET
ncbi:MAG: selenocysteine-specific translation elongation factor [Alphaproteobacteria bacterium]|jgi:selenocysteine-specific elongation factor|nr:selenocysteine-specific translation elongation factor [Alphaproteobacteria bacterium]